MDGQVECGACGGLGLLVETEEFGSAFPEANECGFGFEASLHFELVVGRMGHEATFGEVHAVALQVDDALGVPGALAVDFDHGRLDAGGDRAERNL